MARKSCTELFYNEKAAEYQTELDEWFDICDEYHINLYDVAIESREYRNLLKKYGISAY